MFLVLLVPDPGEGLGLALLDAQRFLLRSRFTFVLELVLEGAVTTVRGRGAQQQEGDAQMQQHRKDEGRRFRDGGSSAGSHYGMVVGALRIAIRRCGPALKSPAPTSVDTG